MDAATEPVADPAADRRIGKILRRHRLRRRTVGLSIGRGPGAVLSAGVVGALVLSGCASQDPGVPEPAAQTQPITVGADLADAQQADAQMRSYVRDAAGTPSAAEEISKLASLRDQGILTDAEFQQQKSKLLTA